MSTMEKYAKNITTPLGAKKQALKAAAAPLPRALADDDDEEELFGKDELDKVLTSNTTTSNKKSTKSREEMAASLAPAPPPSSDEDDEDDTAAQLNGLLDMDGDDDVAEVHRSVASPVVTKPKATAKKDTSSVKKDTARGKAAATKPAAKRKKADTAAAKDPAEPSEAAEAAPTTQKKKLDPVGRTWDEIMEHLTTATNASTETRAYLARSFGGILWRDRYESGNKSAQPNNCVCRQQMQRVFEG